MTIIITTVLYTIRIHTQIARQVHQKIPTHEWKSHIIIVMGIYRGSFLLFFYFVIVVVWCVNTSWMGDVSISPSSYKGALPIQCIIFLRMYILPLLLLLKWFYIYAVEVGIAFREIDTHERELYLPLKLNGTVASDLSAIFVQILFYPVLSATLLSVFGVVPFSEVFNYFFFLFLVCTFTTFTNICWESSLVNCLFFNARKFANLRILYYQNVNGAILKLHIYETLSTRSGLSEKVLKTWADLVFNLSSKKIMSHGLQTEHVDFAILFIWMTD